MKKKKLLILSIILLVISACSRGTLTSPTEDQNSVPPATFIATSVEATFEAKDSENATSVISTSQAIIEKSVASTLEANDSVISTAVAETVEAIKEISPTNTNTATLVPSVTPTHSISETPALETPTGSLTPTAMASATTRATVPSSATIVTVSVSVDTNCRTGPDKDYERIGIFRVGESAKVLGKKTSYNYWIIENPTAEGECWLWGKYATVEGDTSTLEEYALPPLP
ncbi:MAG TPA: hypothetical protein EYP74_02890 [Anaerolineales bacterium]|nr:hypothetical protein [Anaerolineales bacterium]